MNEIMKAVEEFYSPKDQSRTEANALNWEVPYIRSI